MALLVLLTAGLSLGSLGTGCASTATSASTGEYIDDSSVTVKVKAAFVNDPTVNAFDVAVETFKGVVQLSGFVNAGATRMILNLESLIYISSAGLRSILVAAKLIKTLNGDMRMCEASGLVAQILETCGFSNLVKIDAHEEDSIKALGGNL